MTTKANIGLILTLSKYISTLLHCFSPYVIAACGSHPYTEGGDTTVAEYYSLSE